MDAVTYNARHMLRRAVRDTLLKLDWLIFRVYAACGRLLRRLHPEWDARRWSNAELEKVAPLVRGRVINVSGWQDGDKQGRRYADYFTQRTDYVISNIGGARGRSETPGPGELFLDLTRPLDEELRGAFDAVFNHTVLEHVFEIRQAIENLCALSRDLVIAVVPFQQMVHYDAGSYLDYWRLSPFAMERLFEAHGFTLVYWSSNDNPVTNVYLFCVAAREPDRWRPVLAKQGLVQCDDVPGRSSFEYKMPQPR